MSEELFGGKVPSGSPDFRSELAAKLAELVPEAFADGKVDVAKLRELLGSDTSDEKLERFGLFWPGKRRALQAAQELTTATLLPDLENSRDWDTTGNVFIEGDNLEVLKILQRHYHGKIKMIYIDPPYNTGKDFVYPDNYKEGLASYLEWTKQVNEEGKRISTNSDTDGRYHSNWLSMMYPRLKLAKNLLTEDGLVFISIDDTEVDNLKRICNEIFGEDSFVAIAPRKTGAGAAATRSDSELRKLNDFVLIYTRSEKSVFSKKVTGQKEYPFEDSVGKYALAQFQASGSDATRKARPNMWYPIFVLENGDLTTTKPVEFVMEIIPKEVDGEEGRWLWSKDKFEVDHKHLLHFDGSTLSRKIYFDENADQNVYQVEKAWFEGFTNASGTKEVERLFGQKKMFDHPKPIELLKHLFSLHPSKDGYILDFFAGSSSSAQAVDSLNRQDGGTRRWIMVQLPEPTPEGSAAKKHGYRTISQLSRKRISLYFDTLSETLFDSSTLDSQAMGFRAFSLAESNFPVWRVSSGVAVSELEKHINEIAYSSADEANSFDCLIEVLIKLGFSLNVPLKLIDNEVFEAYSVGDGDFIAVVGSKKSAEVDDFATLLDFKPSRLLVMEDTYQGSDELKTNLEQECSNRQIEMIKK